MLSLIFFFHEVYCPCSNLGTSNNIIFPTIPSVSFDWLFNILLCLKGEMPVVEMPAPVEKESLPELFSRMELLQKGN